MSRARAAGEALPAMVLPQTPNELKEYQTLLDTLGQELVHWLSSLELARLRRLRALIEVWMYQ